jgi:hypothetical protein
MGGTALLIYGHLSADRLRPRPLPRNWLDRLLGRTRERSPRTVTMGHNRELLEVDAAELEPLVARFREFLAREIPVPHSASAQTLEYLDIKGIPSLYLRAESEGGGEPEWYTQVTFSGCAGMAEISALVAAHWAEAWARRELPALEREILTPFGFTPRKEQRFESTDRFLPMEELGYLHWLPEEDREEDEVLFEVDHAVIEAIEGTPDRLTAVSDQYAKLMTDGRCRCQLCAPEFEPLAVA